MPESPVVSPAPPSPAFVGVSWLALLAGALGFLVGLWNARMALSEKGFYLTVLLFGLFAAVSLQKAVRDRLEDVPVTGLYLGLCWLGAGSAVVLLTVGLWNAHLARSEKGFYAMAFALAMFAAVAVQKNVRDLAAAGPRSAPDGEQDPFAEHPARPLG